MKLVTAFLLVAACCPHAGAPTASPTVAQPAATQASSKPAPAPARAHTACSLIRADNVSFQAANEALDDEYLTYEWAESDGVTFYLKAGHGVARLEAWIGGQLVANTFYSTGRDPSETDTLSLEVRTPAGETLEAGCYEVDKVIE